MQRAPPLSCISCQVPNFFPLPSFFRQVAEAPRPDKEEKKVAPVTSPADNGGSNADGGGKATTDLLALQKAADALKPKQSGTSGGDGGGRFVPPKTDKAPEVVVPSDDNVVAAPKKELPSKHLAQQQQQGGGGGSKDSSSNNNAVGALHGLTDMRMLLIKCYKASLPADEVKECVAAARQGKPYTAKVRLESAAGGSGDDADGARTLQQADVAAVKAPHVGQPRFSWRQYVAHMTTWQALLLWVIVLWALLGLGPKLLKKRGPKSMRQLE